MICARFFLLVSFLLSIAHDSENADLVSHYGGSVTLTCDFDPDIDEPQMVAWFYNDKYDEQNSRKYADSTTETGKEMGTLMNRSSVDFWSGDMTITELEGCNDDQTYTCETWDNQWTAKEHNTHTVVVMRPDAPELIVGLGIETYSFGPGTCSDPRNVIVLNGTLQLSASISAISKPGCKITLTVKDQTIDALCEDGNPNCPTEKTCKAEKKFSASIGDTIKSQVTYEGTKWSYCVALLEVKRRDPCGIPSTAPVISIQNDEDGKTFQYHPSGNCKNNTLEFMRDNDEFKVTIRSKVVSNPAVDFYLNEYGVERNCSAEANCPGAMICAMTERYIVAFPDLMKDFGSGKEEEDMPTVEYPETDIRIHIKYEGEKTWEFCIQPKKYHDFFNIAVRHPCSVCLLSCVLFMLFVHFY